MLQLVALAAAVPNEVDQRLSRMTALYEEVCLKAFPDDKAVDALMAAKKARPLAPDVVKITFRDDPGRAWQLPDGSATVWLELPPFHACSVRWNTPEIGNLEHYRTLADKYERQKGGFAPLEPMNADQGDIHTHPVGEQRILPDRRTESLFIFDQQITDPKRRAAGETGIVLRFVHQFAPPPPEVTGTTN